MRIGSLTFTPALLPTLATAVLLPVLVGLGTWQLDRAREKELLRAAFDARASEVPVYLNPRLEQLGAGTLDWEWWHYRLVEVAGRYQPEHQYLLDNRTLDGVAGYEVLTPFALEGSRFAVLVDRGWVPVGARRDRLPAVPARGGLTVLRGLVDRARTPLLLGSAGYADGGWPRVVQSVDLEAIAGQITRPLLPFVLLLEPDAPHGFVRRWTPYVGIGPDRHRAYAFQWFTLAVTLLAIWVVVNLRRGRR